MSLYAGINLQKSKSPLDGGAAAPASTISSSAPLKDNSTPTTDPAESKSDAPVPVASTQTSTGNWSAALRFAPSKRKKPITNTIAKPVALRNAFADTDDSVATPAVAPRIVGRAKAALVPSAHEQSTTSIASGPSSSTSKPVNLSRESPIAGSIAPASRATRVGRVIAKPPPMTLDDDDVNGFRQSTAGKTSMRNENRGSRKKGKRKEDPALQFGDTPYDPARPCDYTKSAFAPWDPDTQYPQSAYKAHVQGLRAQRRLEQEQERRRQRSPSGSSYESGSGDEYSDDNGRMNKKTRFFAPPTSYDDPPARHLLPSNEETPDTKAPAPTPAVRISREETGEEAYLRRLAMSTGKVAPQARAPEPSSVPSSSTTYSTFSPATTAPSFVSASRPNVAPPALPPQEAQQQQSIPLPPPGFIPPSFFAPPGTDDFPPFQPLPSDLAPTTPSSDANKAIADAQAKAREIAARLGRMSALQPPQADAPVVEGNEPALTQPSTSDAVPTSEPDNRSFADRMMAKFGWEAGKGLGASESGMTTALSVAKPVTASSKKAKKKQDESNEPAPTGMAAKRATIVDSTRESRIANQKSELGEPSRVVLLTNLCGLDDLDDELGNEVAEEANKFGVVERCFVYQVPHETRDEEAVRIFLVMSGLAGGYNAVRQFDGRFFGGRVVKARFYDEAAFNAGQHLLPTAS